MRYVLRADASRAIGAGHVMRSSAIAEELIRRGETVIFVGQISDLPWVEERIKSLKFTNVYSDPKEFNSNPESDVLVLDTYGIDINDAFLSPERWRNIVAIVDELTPRYSCTLRIHPGLDREWTGESMVPILSGPKYIPLRSNLSNFMYVSKGEQQNLKIAVVAGGSDPFGLVYKVAKILAKIPEKFEVYLFSSSETESALDSRFHVVQVGLQLDELTKDADLVLTTASTLCLEFLARGVCVGLICAVENQQQNYNYLGKLGVAAQVGFQTLDNNWDFDEQKIYSLVTSSEIRRNLVAKSKGLIDFNGASRIVDTITTL
jgi:spore coat polysaccharide biosynthesis predicted glycosyltransferase SpsG